MKKIVIMAAAVAAVGIIGGAIWFGVRQMNQKQVKVYAVSDLSQGYWGSEMGVGGMIVSSVSQDVYLTDKQMVEEVFVKEGDTVEEGDDLLSYDMTLVDIDLQIQKLNKEGLEIQKKGLEQEIEKLRKVTPIATSNEGAGTILRLISNDQEEQLDSDKDPNPEVSEVIPYASLDVNAHPYQGKGTADDPYVFLCEENVSITGAFLNKLAGFEEADKRINSGAVALLELREGGTVSGRLLAAFRIDGSKFTIAFDADAKFLIGLISTSEEVTETPDPEEDPEIDMEDLGTAISPEEIIAGYTKEELEQAIREKQEELRDLELNIKEIDLKINKSTSQLENQTVTSTIKGTVKSVGDPLKGAVDGTPFIQVVSSEGLYVQSSVNELLLDQVTVGQKLTGMAYESGISFEAEIKEISVYPTTGNSFGGMGNVNASYYPFTAYIENGEGMKNQEYVEMQMNLQEEGNLDALYIETLFIREEAGKHYVYKVDGHDRLKKQYVTVGKTLYGSYLEIKDGISKEDRIAFPYDKNAKENAKTKDASLEELYY